MERAGPQSCRSEPSDFSKVCKDRVNSRSAVMISLGKAFKNVNPPQQTNLMHTKSDTQSYRKQSVASGSVSSISYLASPKSNTAVGVNTHLEVTEKSVDNADNAFVDILSEMVEEGSKQKLRKLLVDSIFTKAIVLNNQKAQVNATTQSSKEKRKAKRRQHNSLLSKGEIKRRKIFDPLSQPPSLAAIEILHISWCQYMIGLMKNNSSASAISAPQLQARLQAAALIGAFVAVIREKPDILPLSASSVSSLSSGLTKKSYVTSGFITSTSQNCYYIAVVSPNLCRSIGTTCPPNESSPLTVTRVIKSECIIVMYLPTVEDTKSQLQLDKRLQSYSNAMTCSDVATNRNVCLFYGGRFMADAKDSSS